MFFMHLNTKQGFFQVYKLYLCQMPAEDFTGLLLVSRLNGRNLGDLLAYKGIENLEQNLPPWVKPSSVEWQKGVRGQLY